jgi:multimeric flavodoxin WrbA
LNWNGYTVNRSRAGKGRDGLNILVFNGTPLKGVTYHMKEMFLRPLREDNTIREFYPADFPAFCVGCKNCFFRGEDTCPHVSSVKPIWEAFLRADLLVFAYPVYALRAPAAIKSLLDHFCVHWMVHRPDPAVFRKTAVVITNSVGAPNGAAQRDVKTSMTWMGVSRVLTCGAGLMGDILWPSMTDSRKAMLKKKMQKLAHKAAAVKPRTRKSVQVAALFAVCKRLHAATLKTEDKPGLDNQHFIDLGWINGKQKK